MMTLTSDIRLSFEQLGISFQRILDDKAIELKGILNNVIENFDFEKVFTAHVNNLIEEGLEKAIEDIELSGQLKDIIYKEIGKKLSKVM